MAAGTPKLAWLARLRWSILLASILWGAGGAASPSWGASSEVALKVLIPPQELMSALHRFSQSTGVQVLVLSEYASGKTSGAVDGVLRPAQILDRMLVGSGLGYEWVNERTVRIELMAAQPSTRTAVAAKSPSLPPETGIAREPVAGNLEELVVTAQRREELLQRVPIAVSAVPAVGLKQSGVTRIEELSQLVPGLQIVQEENGIVPFLRGVGQSTSQTGVESSVSIYVDGIYYPSPSGGLFSFNNIERVEVLKGPQGTLFGRNAVGGVIQVVTRDPQHTPLVDASLSYGNYNTVESTAYLTTGVTQDLAIDLSLYLRKQFAGWGHNFPSNSATYADEEVDLRTKALWTPTDDFVLRFAADFEGDRQDISTAIFPGSIGLDGVSTNVGFYNGLNGTNDYSRDHIWGTSLNATYDFKVVKLVSITSARHTHTPYTVDQDSTPARIVLASPDDAYDEDLTQEFQLQSPANSDNHSWIVGLFYMHDQAGFDPIQINGSAVAPFDALQIRGITRLNSLAEFAQGSVQVLPATQFTLGARYTRDNRSITGSSFGLLGDTTSDLTSNPAQQAVTFSKATFRAALDHNFTDDIMVYASYNRGFKSGFYNTISYSSEPVKPEILDAAEIGMKSELLSHVLRLNISGYLYKYKNLQLPESQNGTTYYLNAASATIKGIDADVTFAPTRELTVQGGVAYAHGRYDSFLNAPLYTPNPGGGNALTSFDASGLTTSHTPAWMSMLTATYLIHTSRGTLAPTLSYSYDDGFCWDADCHVRQPSYNLVNGSLQWTSADAHRGVSLWVKNMFDQQYFRWANEQQPNFEYLPAAPRTYGVTFHWKTQ